MRDVFDGMVNHLGGADYVSDPQRMTARRVAVMEAELIHLEDSFARVRAGGGEPPPSAIDLYSRVASAQRRHLELLGLNRVPRDVTPTLEQYLASKHAEDAEV
jgi:hypothetical protein